MAATVDLPDVADKGSVSRRIDGEIDLLADADAAHIGFIDPGGRVGLSARSAETREVPYTEAKYRTFLPADRSG